MKASENLHIKADNLFLHSMFHVYFSSAYTKHPIVQIVRQFTIKFLYHCTLYTVILHILLHCHYPKVLTVITVHLVNAIVNIMWLLLLWRTNKEPSIRNYICNLTYNQSKGSSLPCLVRCGNESFFCFTYCFAHDFMSYCLYWVTANGYFLEVLHTSVKSIVIELAKIQVGHTNSFILDHNYPGDNTCYNKCNLYSVLVENTDVLMLGQQYWNIRLPVLNDQTKNQKGMTSIWINMCLTVSTINYISSPFLWHLSQPAYYSMYSE